MEAVEKGEIKKGEKTVAVLRYLGPKGGPGESVSHVIISRFDFAFVARNIWGSREACDTNVSLRSIPFHGSLSGLRRPLLFPLPLFSIPPAGT